jgi:ribosomal-protein-alanine N-acetyltransferase
VIIRLAGPADAADLADLHAAVLPTGWSKADFGVWLSHPESFAVIAIREREAVAFGLALAAGADGDLLTIGTRPDCRREGLGRSILFALEEEAQKRGLRRWVLEVADTNAAALGLYKSEGFVEIGVRKAYYSHPEGRIDALVLSRPVMSGHGCP